MWQDNWDELMGELLWQAADGLALGLAPVRLVAVCNHGSAAGAVSSFKLETS